MKKIYKTKSPIFFDFLCVLGYTMSKNFIIYAISMKRLMIYILTWLSLIIWFWLIWWNIYAQEDGGSTPEPTTTEECNWIKLITDFPIIWNCIKTKGSKTNPTNAFPYMIWALTKIIMSLILVVCFILIIYSWILRASDDPKWATNMLKKVAIAILLLWFSWAILRLINPNFFS